MSLKQNNKYTFIVWPEGDFDGFSYLVEAESMEEALRDVFDANEYDLDEEVSVMPFDVEKVKTFKLTQKIEEVSNEP